MTRQHLRPSILNRLCLGALCGLLATTSAGAQADVEVVDEAGPELALELDYYVLIPPPLHYSQQPEEAFQRNPLIVPYSGCYFFGPDNSPQPWRRRMYSDAYSDAYLDSWYGGQGAVLSENLQVQFRCRTPARDQSVDSDDIPVIGPVNTEDFQAWGASTGINEDGQFQLYLFEAEFEAIPDIPDRTTLELSFWAEEESESIAQTHEIQLDAARAILPADLVQEEIELTEDDRFGTTAVVHVESFTPGAPCLVDLDTARVIHLPSPAPEGEQLAMFLEQEGIDLIILVEHGGLIARACGCPLYQIHSEQWEDSPSDCVTHIAEYELQVPNFNNRAGVNHWSRLETPLSHAGATVLTTTCDGTLLIFRVKQASVDEDTGTGRATLEIRRLERP